MKAYSTLRAHPTLIPLALFALAFGGSLFALKRPGSPVAASAAAPSALGRGGLPGGAVALPNVAAPPVASALPPPPVPEPLPAPDDFAASLPPDYPPPPPDDVAQTIDTLRNGTPGDRVLAIQSLTATGHSGRARGRVRQSLRFAAADQDPEIAARAQEAYDSLTKREDP